ncbi:hypothetical protein L6Q96_22755 [Candidatus Binatia bacterium]|nr:hypothetical protein [Candidatus Binatia bacterium]
MQIETVDLYVQRGARGIHRHRCVAADADDPRPGARPGCEPTEHGGTLNLGIHRTVEEPLVAGVDLGARYAMAGDQPHDAPADRSQ